jgi:hypothetical protein
LNQIFNNSLVIEATQPCLRGSCVIHSRPVSGAGGVFHPHWLQQGQTGWATGPSLLIPHTTFAKASSSLNSSLSLPCLYKCRPGEHFPHGASVGVLIRLALILR